MDAVAFRNAREDDIAQLTALLEKLFAIEADFNFSPELQRRGLALLLRSPSASIIVAHDHTKIVGMVTGQLVISTAEGGPALLVEDLYVVQKSRGRGIGRMLLEKIGLWAHGHGAKRLQLLADRDNLGALQFYRAAGWQPTRLICLRKYHDGEKS